MTIKKVYIGGWFQRTTLHLTELWDFFKYGSSVLDLSPGALADARTALGIRACTRESGPLEYLALATDGGIACRIYEDGLIVLEKEPSEHLANDFAAIKSYYDDRLSKSISLIFSKGAPVPKELADIKTILPYILTVEDGAREEIEKLFRDCNEEIYSVVSAEGVEVYRATGVIVINNLRDQDLAREIIESQIFFREFKTQLHRYLQIHRSVWEKIARVKERGAVKGTEIDALRSELSDYQKTIHLIGARIAQMNAYLATRKKIADTKNIGEYLRPLFQFKYETLADTHEYIKHLWGMTESYLASALELFAELQQKSTKNTISSLQVITTIGVVAGIVGYLGKDALPAFTAMGMFYFALLLAMAWILNKTVSSVFKNKRYPIRLKTTKL